MRRPGLSGLKARLRAIRDGPGRRAVAAARRHGPVVLGVLAAIAAAILLARRGDAAPGRKILHRFRGIGATMEYVDAKGARTRRTIRPSRIYSDGDRLYLTAFCLLRGAPRTFRVDRIVSFIDEDGVVHEPGALAQRPED